MNYDEIITCGYEAWLPSSHACDLDPWLAEDVPTLGSFTHKGELVLFGASDRVDTRVTAWAYVVLTPGQAADLEGRTFGSAREMRDFFEDAARSQSEVEFALADEDFKVINKGSIDVKRGDVLQLMFTRFLGQVLDVLRDKAEARTVVRAQVAEAAELAPVVGRQLDYTGV